MSNLPACTFHFAGIDLISPSVARVQHRRSRDIHFYYGIIIAFILCWRKVRRPYGMGHKWRMSPVRTADDARSVQVCIVCSLLLCDF